MLGRCSSHTSCGIVQIYILDDEKQSQRLAMSLGFVGSGQHSPKAQTGGGVLIAIIPHNLEFRQYARFY